MNRSWGNWAPLPLRLIFGSWLAYHGGLKLFTKQGHENVIQLLAQVHVPYPKVMVWYVGISEFFGGLLLVVGFCVTLVCILNVLNLLGNMLNAWWYGAPVPLECTPTWVCEPFPNDEVSLLYIGAFLALILGGSGAWSIDRLLRGEGDVSLSARVRNLLWR